MPDDLHCWNPPLPLVLVPTSDADSFARMPPGHTGLPLPPHPGSFGFTRRHHTHEGVDLYAPVGTPVMCVEDGVVVKVEDFTGPAAKTPWWLDTKAVFVEGESGVVVYGEIEPFDAIAVGVGVIAGQQIGKVVAVLKKDKGRPGAMLHIELHAPGTREAPAWEDRRPTSLRDPTEWLMGCSPCKNLLQG